MTNTLYGVNLGGWLVVEKWLTPSVFAGTDAVDEYTLSRTRGAKARLKKHRDTFITEKDFRWLATHGVGLVRIPVGYWLFDAVDGYFPAVSYLDDAMRWADEHGIKVLIDLHAAPGSQNGFDSSGRKGAALWYDDKDFQRQTIDVLVRIAERYKDAPALWGIELLNEPTPGRHHLTLLRFYRDAYTALRPLLRPSTAIVYHDAFKPWIYAFALWPRFRRGPNPVLMDVHWYGFLLRSKTLDTYLRRSAHIRRAAVAVLRRLHPVIVGEWSSVLPQRFFDEVPKTDHLDLLRRNVSMQHDAYKKAAGFMYWNYKADGEGMWNFRSLVESGVVIL